MGTIVQNTTVQQPTAKPAPYAPPLAKDGLPVPGVDESTVIALNLHGVLVKAGLFFHDDPQGTAEIAVWNDLPTDCNDLSMGDAERVLTELPVFTEGFRSLTEKLAMVQAGAR